MNSTADAHSINPDQDLYLYLLQSVGIHSFQLDYMEPDCSPRTYTRVLSDQNYIIMDCRNDASITNKFANTTTILENAGINCPKI
jgi:hypothetical protein